MKTVLGIILILAGLVLAAYLSLYVMLYGGIIQALDGWGVDNADVALGIIRAVLFSMGAIPGYILMFAGMTAIK